MATLLMMCDRRNDELVIYGAAAQAPFVAVRHEIQDILTFHLIDVGFAVGLAQQSI